MTNSEIYAALDYFKKRSRYWIRDYLKYLGAQTLLEESDSWNRRSVLQKILAGKTRSYTNKMSWELETKLEKAKMDKRGISNDKP